MKSSAKSSKAPKKRRPEATEAADVSPRIARRERRRERSREEILEATRRILFRDGIGATTLDAVAKEVGVSKTALYYYFSSKEALLFEIVFAAHEAHANAIHEAVDGAKEGGDALRAIIGETVRSFAPRLDDFRLAFLHGQVAGPSAVPMDASKLERIRPLNDLMYGGTAKRLTDERRRAPSRARVEPRLVAFLAHAAAVGLLTMKGMVENVGDPLIYSDEQLIEGMARIFEAAATP